MSKLLCVVFSVWLLKSTGAFPQYDLGGSMAMGEVHCRDNLEYPNGNICCLNCPAGTHMTSPCTRDREKGKCEECNYGTYTQHGNGLLHCFRCTQCRPDQEIVTPCSHTHDTECQCKSGRFCDPDQACEVCKKCSSCEEDEEIVRPCTSTANTVCKKIHPSPVSISAKTWMIGLAIAPIALLIVIIVAVYISRRRRATDSQRHLTEELKAGQHYSDNCPPGERGNGEPQRPSGSSLTLPHLEDEQFPKLVPVNGEESLRKCFECFEEIDVNFHKRFFRHLGITDNVIKSKEHLPYEDKIHELLNIWVEKEGREASLNDLLKALLDLNQRRTAEMIKEKAIHSSYYFCEY